MSELPSPTTRSIQHAYGESSPYSLGVEEEFQLVDGATFELVPRVEEVLGHATDGERLHIKQELMQSVVEIATPICLDSAAVRRELGLLRTRLAELARESSCRIASSGTHPFARYDLQQITDAPRYHQMLERMQWIAQRELVFGLHTHVGMRSPDQAMYVFNHIRRYLPELLALSVNSPFWQGRDTGLASSRSKVFDSFPRSGIPPVFNGWDDWKSLIRRAMDAGAIEDYTYVWWDVRPHPKFGTVEIRVCDAQTSIEDSLALAALIQAVAAWLGEQFDSGIRREVHPTFLIQENKWNAARYGLEGSFIDFDTDRPMPTREAVAQLIDSVAGHASELGSDREFEHLQSMLQKTGAERQRAWFDEHRDLQHVGRELALETEKTANERIEQ